METYLVCFPLFSTSNEGKFMFTYNRKEVQVTFFLSGITRRICFRFVFQQNNRFQCVSHFKGIVRSRIYFRFVLLLQKKKMFSPLQGYKKSYLHSICFSTSIGDFNLTSDESYSPFSACMTILNFKKNPPMMLGQHTIYLIIVVYR